MEASCNNNCQGGERGLCEWGPEEVDIERHFVNWGIRGSRGNLGPALTSANNDVWSEGGPKWINHREKSQQTPRAESWQMRMFQIKPWKKCKPLYYGWKKSFLWSPSGVAEHHPLFLWGIVNNGASDWDPLFRGSLSWFFPPICHCFPRSGYVPCSLIPSPQSVKSITAPPLLANWDTSRADCNPSSIKNRNHHKLRLAVQVQDWTSMVLLSVVFTRCPKPIRTWPDVNVLYST